MKRLTYFLIPILIFIQFGCSSSDNGNNNSSSEVFSESSTGLEIFTLQSPTGNTFTCNTCHSASPVDTSAFRLVGHDVTDAHARSTYKNGQITELREAVNSCLEHWMGAETFEETTPEWLALMSWFQDISPATTTDLTYNIIDPPVDLSGGDTVEGMQAFNETCARCHGMNAVGTDRGPTLAGTGRTPEQIALRIRNSGPLNTGIYEGLIGGIMPFWAEDQLSDAELVNIVQFLDDSEPIQPAPTNSMDLSVANAQTTGACGNDHPSVGRTSTFVSSPQYNIAGDLEIIDNCTIEIRNFEYRGGGITVEFYAGVDGDYSPNDNPPGFGISQNIRGTSFNGETVRIRLPVGVSLDQFNGLSVWCVPVRLNFGSAEW